MPVAWSSNSRFGPVAHDRRLGVFNPRDRLLASGNRCLPLGKIEGFLQGPSLLDGFFNKFGRIHRDSS